jgi:hypothetical protein
MMKKKPIVIFHNSKLFALIAKSSFINLCDSSDYDSPSLPDVVVDVSANSQVDQK